jgi:hypothetical protein
MVRRVRITVDSDGAPRFSLDYADTSASHATYADRVQARLERLAARTSDEKARASLNRRRAVRIETGQPCPMIACPCCWPRYQLTLPGAPVHREPSFEPVAASSYQGDEDLRTGPAPREGIADPRKMGRIWAVAAWPNNHPDVWRACAYQPIRAEGPAWWLELTTWHVTAAANNPRPALTYVDKRGDRAREAREKKADAAWEHYHGNDESSD